MSWVSELAKTRKVWQKYLSEAMEAGDKQLENALRKEIKDTAELERQYSKVPATTGQAPREKVSIGTPVDKYAEYMEKQLEQASSRIENLRSQTRKESAEAKQRGFNQGRTEGVIDAEGSTKLTKYTPPGTLSTIRKIKEEGVADTELFEAIPQKGADADIIDVEARDVAPLQLKAGEGDANYQYAAPADARLRSPGEAKAKAQFTAEGFEKAAPSPASTLSGLKKAVTAGAGLASAGGIYLAGGEDETKPAGEGTKPAPVYGKVESRQAGFPGEPSTEELMAEERADAARQAETSRTVDRKRLGELEQGISALTGALKASGDTPNTALVQSLEGLQTEKSSLLKRLETPSSEVRTELAGPKSAAPLKPGQKGPFGDVTLYDALLRSEQDKGKIPEKEAAKLTPAVSATPASAAAAMELETPKTKSLMDRLQEERTEAKAEREAATKKADIGELASIIGRGLSQIGAAASGMRSGFDMSNIAKESLIDWDKRRDQIMSTYKQNISEIDSQQAKLERAQERADDQAEKEQYRRQQLKLEYDKMKQNADIAAAKLDVDVLAAIAKRDEKALAANEKKIEAELADLDKQEAALRKVEELMVEGKKLPVIAGELAKLYSKAETEKTGILGWPTLKSKSEIEESVASKRQAIEAQRQAALKRRGTLTSYQQAEAPAATPAAPAPTAQTLVDMVAPDGRVLKVPAEKVAELEAKGAKRK